MSTSARGKAARLDATWEQIYDQHGDKVFRLIFRLVRCREAAADLTHDTFVRVYERAHMFDGRGPLGAWVFQIGRNLARDYVKRRHPFVDPPNTADGIEPAAVGPGLDNEARLTMSAAVAQIPDDYRVVLLLWELDGYTHQEIAQMLDIAEGTSKARLSRGRSMLRKALGQR